MPLPIFGFPVVAAKLPFNDDFLPLFGLRSKVLSGPTPHDYVYESSDLLAVATVVVEELVVSNSDRREGSARIGFSQGWVRDQITADDDVIDAHSSMGLLVGYLNGRHPAVRGIGPFVLCSPLLSPESVGFRFGEKK